MDKWFKNAVVYAMDISSFCDSNGDGIGDFYGATQKLDYLAHLGITCIWVLPFYYSPGRDNGYDISDYYLIDPELGTIDDFIRFIEEAEKRSIRVILDLVVNHTSTEHPWFKAGRYSKSSPFYNYYIWRSDPPVRQGENTFKEKESGTWKYDDLAREYYYHKFYHFEASLNFKNPEVREEVKRIIRYWMSFGIYGFRIDAATHLFDQFSNDPQNGEVSKEEVMNELFEYVTGIREDAALIGEADVPLDKADEYIGKGDRMNMLFNFLLNNSLFLSLATEDASAIAERLSQLPDIPDTFQWVNFVRNLDELDLEQLSVEDRQQVFNAFAPNPEMQIYGRGIRRRVAPMLQGNLPRIKMTFNILMALPGSPMITYGDEIGMGDNLVYEQRLCVRTPMQWNAEENAGFSTAKPELIPLAPIDHGVFSYRFVNVARQEADSASLLNTIRNFITVRKQCEIIGSVRPSTITMQDPAILCLEYKDNKEELLVYINLSGNEKLLEIDKSLSVYTTVLENQPYSAQSGDNMLALSAYGFRWLYKK